MSEGKGRPDKAARTGKRSGTLLHKDDEIFRILVETAGAGIAILDRQGDLTFVNERLCLLTGYSREELIGFPFASFVHKDDAPYLTEVFHKALDGVKRSEMLQFRLVGKDGRVIWVHSNPEPMVNGGQTIGFSAIVYDISDRKQLEEALVKSESRYRTMLDQMQDTYHELDLEGKFTFVSESATRSFGYLQEELIGQSFRVAVPEEDIREIFAAFNEVYRTGKPNKGFAHRIRRRDGSITYSEASVDLNRDTQGKITGFKVINRDITGRRQMEEELRRLASVVQYSSELVNLATLEGQMIFLNEAGANMLGIDPQEVGKYNVIQVIPDHLKEIARTDVLAALSKGDEWEGDLQYLNLKTGQLTDVHAMTFAIKDRLTGVPSYIANVSLDITERKKVETALRESEDQLRASLEDAPDGVYMNDMNGTFLYGNRRCEEIIGYGRQELIGRNFLELKILPETSLAMAAKILRDNIDGKSTGPDELELIHKDGHHVPVEIKTSLVMREGNMVVLAFVRDITERRKAEAAARESEARFKNMVEHITDIFYMLDSGYQMLYISPQAEQVLGYPVEQLRNNWRNTVTDNPLNLSAHEKTQLALTTGEKQGPYLQEFMHRDGTVRLVEINESPVKNERGEVIGIVGAARDITERKRIESALVESEEKYRLLVESALETICITVEGVLKFVNSRATELTGYSQEELISRSIMELVHPDSRQIAAEIRLKRLKGIDVPSQYTFRLVCKSGDIKWVELSMIPITWEGKPASLNFLTDITDRRRLEEEQQRVAKLESVGLLAGGIAHDFNNILTSILGNISLARTEALPGSELQDSLEYAEKASQRARDLTQQLLTFSRGGAPVKKLASLKELINETAGFAVRGSNVKCRLSIPDELWHAQVDPGQISQVVQNLVINAQQAMPDGGIVDITAENMFLSETQRLGRGLPLNEGNYVRVAVTDEGSGISEEHLNRIFDPFFTTKQKGHGLGLATSFSIARNHGGHISVESSPGSGSTFYLYLPASPETVSSKQSHRDVMRSTGGDRVLVMDDEQGVREVAGRMLRHLGYHDIEFASDGAQAIHQYKAAMEAGKPFSVVIFDLTIPGGMGGRESIRELLKVDPAARAIVSSGYADQSVMAAYKEYGFSGMIAKPYTLEELRKALHEVTG